MYQEYGEHPLLILHAFFKKYATRGGGCTEMSRVAQLKMYGTKGVPPASSHTKNKENLLEIDG